MDRGGVGRVGRCLNRTPPIHSTETAANLQVLPNEWCDKQFQTRLPTAPQLTFRRTAESGAECFDSAFQRRRFYGAATGFAVGEFGIVRRCNDNVSVR